MCIEQIVYLPWSQCQFCSEKMWHSHQCSYRFPTVCCHWCWLSVSCGLQKVKILLSPSPIPMANMGRIDVWLSNWLCACQKHYVKAAGLLYVNAHLLKYDSVDRIHINVCRMYTTNSTIRQAFRYTTILPIQWLCVTTKLSLAFGVKCGPVQVSSVHIVTVTAQKCQGVIIDVCRCMAHSAHNCSMAAPIVHTYCWLQMSNVNFRCINPLKCSGVR